MFSNFFPYIFSRLILVSLYSKTRYVSKRIGYCYYNVVLVNSYIL